MKRFIALFLCAVLCLSVFAGCGEEKPAETGSGIFQVGYGMADVTPTESIPLDGYAGADSAEYRRSASTEWPLQVVTVAFTDENNNTLLFITLDFLNAYMADSMREAIANETGIPKDHIMFHVTHNHSGPSLRVDHPAIPPYINQLTGSVLNSAKTALADRKPVTGLYTTFARPEGCNTERHYLLADGAYQSYGVGSVPKDQIIGHYGVADNLLQLVKFTREGGKDVVMVNWQGHPPSTNPNTIMTANYPGVLRNYLDQNLGCLSTFVLSGSGNLNNGSQIAGDIRHDDYQELGQNLGAAAVEAAVSFTQRNVGDLQVKEKILQLDTRDGGARKVWLYAISMGDFAFVTAPFEIFDDNAVAVRESSPYAMTMYASCCNGSNGYLPTPPSFGWETTYESRITEFPDGTAAIVETELKGMLAALASESDYQAVEKPADYYQAEFTPKSDGVTYINFTPDDMTKIKPVENGFYAFQLLNGSKIKNFLAIDEATAKAVMEKTEVKLLLNEQNVVVGIVE